MESRNNYSILAVITAVVIILQFAVAKGIFNPDINMAVLLTLTLVIIFIKIAEIFFLAIKTPPPPRPKTIYFFTSGVIFTSVVLIYVISKMFNDTGNTESLITGLFIVALASQIVGMAAVRSGRYPAAGMSSPKDERMTI